jgi:hypothetical protein
MRSVRTWMECAWDSNVSFTDRLRAFCRAAVSVISRLGVMERLSPRLSKKPKIDPRTTRLDSGRSLLADDDRTGARWERVSQIA